MRTIIAGSRDIYSYSTLLKAVEKAKAWGISVTSVVSGGARGVDALGEQYARENNLPLSVFKPDWSLGKSAGPIRNQNMADSEGVEALIAVTNGSRGTADMIRRAKDKGLRVYIEQV
jgi:hypothetical protein